MTEGAQLDHVRELFFGGKKHVLLLIHRNPDGDAIGSAYALRRVLRMVGHEVTVACPSDYPFNFRWVEGIDKMLIGDRHPQKVRQSVRRAQIIVYLDFNTFQRIDGIANYLEEAAAYTILIDHHKEPLIRADFQLSEPDASSTSELVYRFILHVLDRADLIDRAVAELIYAGILTDTGKFRHNTSARLFRIMAELKDVGLDDLKIFDRIYNSLQEKHLRLIGHALHNRFIHWQDYRTAFIYLNKDDYRQFDIKRGDTEGLVNYPMMLEDIVLSALITEQQNIIKISLRSKGEVDVQQLAKRYFNGGGHKNAAGGYHQGPLEQTIADFKRAVEEFVTAQMKNSNSSS